jgi:hypothetical protein
VEAHLFSRWKGVGSHIEDHKLLRTEFCMDYNQEIDPKMLIVGQRQQKNGLIINDTESCGLWPTLNQYQTEYDMTSLMCMMSQDNLTRWNLENITVDMKIDSILKAHRARLENVPPPRFAGHILGQPDLMGLMRVYCCPRISQ